MSNVAVLTFARKPAPRRCRLIVCGTVARTQTSRRRGERIVAHGEMDLRKHLSVDFIPQPVRGSDYFTAEMQERWHA